MKTVKLLQKYGWCIFPLLPGLIRCCWSQSVDKRESQSQQLLCADNLELTTIENHYLLEVFGTPDETTQDDIDELEQSFLAAWNSSTSCEWSDLQVAILSEVMGGSARGASDVVSKEDERDFAFIVWVSAQSCIIQGSEPPAFFSDILTSHHSLRQGSLTPYSGDKHGSTICQGPSLAQFLANWKEVDMAASFNIVALTPLFIANGCSLAPFHEFSSCVDIAMSTSHDDTYWTDSMLDSTSQLFMKSYNQVNILNPSLCDPKHRQIIRTKAEVLELTNATVSLRISFNGICQNCDTHSYLFDRERTLEQHAFRNLQESEQMQCLCPNTNDTVWRGPFLEEFVSDFQLAVEQDLSFVHSFLQVQASSMCPYEEVTTLESSLLLDYQMLCETFPESDISFLEEAIMFVYNDLQDSLYCDPSMRRVSRVTFMSFEAFGDDDRVTFEFLVFGICPECVMMSPSLFDVVSLHGTLNDPTRDSSSNALCLTSNGAPPFLMNRAPTEDEFVRVYESLLLDYAEELICIKAHSRVSGSIDPLVSTQNQLLSNCSFHLWTDLTSDVLVTLNENATQSTLNEFGFGFMNAYNSMINATYPTCQSPNYRLITDISVVWDVSPDGKSSSPEKMLISPGSIIMRLYGKCNACNSSGQFFIPDILNQDDFVLFYERIIGPGISSVIEFQASECSSNITMFEDTAIVELVLDDVDCDFDLEDDLMMQHLEELYIETYNHLAREYCDPYSRQLVSAMITYVGENNTFGNIPLEFQLIGTCSDCLGENVSVFDRPTSMSTESYMGEFVEDGAQLCCPENPIAHRGLYEIEFLDEYRYVLNDTMQQLEEGLTSSCPWMSWSVAECEFGTKFQTGVYVRFQAIQNDFNIFVLQEIEDALKESINTFYQNTVLDCNPEFRIVDYVSATVLTDVTRRRHVEQMVQDETAAPTESCAPSMSPHPSSSFSPSYSFTPSTINPEPPTLISSTTTLFLYVSGLCNGCERELTLNDQTIDTRRVQQLPDLNDNDASVVLSNCFCPIGATIDSASPGLGDLEEKFSTALQERGIAFPIQDFGERSVIDCTIPIRSFHTQLQVPMLLEPTITPAQLQLFGDDVKSSYNSLSNDYCDPVDKRISDIQLKSFSPNSVQNVPNQQCTNYMVTFDVVGTCRGCLDGISLLDVDARRLTAGSSKVIARDLTFVRNNEDDNSRRIQSRAQDFSPGKYEECFCGADALAFRGTNKVAFYTSLNAALSNIQIDSNCQRLIVVPALQPTISPTSLPEVSQTSPSTEPLQPLPTAPSNLRTTVPSKSPSLPSTLSPLIPLSSFPMAGVPTASTMWPVATTRKPTAIPTFPDPAAIPSPLSVPTITVRPPSSSSPSFNTFPVSPPWSPTLTPVATLPSTMVSPQPSSTPAPTAFIPSPISSTLTPTATPTPLGSTISTTMVPTISPQPSSTPNPTAFIPSPVSPTRNPTVSPRPTGPTISPEPTLLVYIGV